MLEFHWSTVLQFEINRKGATKYRQLEDDRNALWLANLMTSVYGTGTNEISVFDINKNGSWICSKIELPWLWLVEIIIDQWEARICVTTRGIFSPRDKKICCLIPSLSLNMWTALCFLCVWWDRENVVCCCVVFCWTRREEKRGDFWIYGIWRGFLCGIPWCLIKERLKSH